MDTPLQTVRLETGKGQNLVVDCVPGAGPAWVFLHGLASSREGAKADMLIAGAAQLGRACYRFDFRGHGESSGSMETVTLSDLCADTSAVLDLVGQPAVLVGSSLGGLVAAWTAARQPERVCGLVLIAPAFGMLDRLAATRDEISGVTFGQHVYDDAEQYDEGILPTQLPMPVLAVHGGADEVVDPQATVRMVAAIPHDAAEAWVVDGADHSLHDSMPQILERLEKFTRSLDPDPEPNPKPLRS